MSVSVYIYIPVLEVQCMAVAITFMLYNHAHAIYEHVYIVIEHQNFRTSEHLLKVKGRMAVALVMCIS